MATKTTSNANDRQRKQLIFIAIGGVVLLALAFLQGPKLWKQLNPPAPKPAAAPAPGTGTGTGTGTTGGAVVAAPTLTGSAVVVKPAPRPGAKSIVAGVTVSPWQVPQATNGQLWTFSRLRAKDPFVQQVDPQSQDSTLPPFSNATNSSRTGASSSTTSSRPATVTQAAPATVAPKQLSPTFATIEVNGNDVRLKLDQRFPPTTKVFKLVALKQRVAQIALAKGGKLGSKGTVTLTMGDSLTLVNSATGKRYTLRLLYTGSEPEVVQEFSTKAK
jgi:hypothetical protein